MAPKLEPRRHELVAIIGASEEDSAWDLVLAEAAKAVGFVIGRLGHGIVTGGLEGVAASACEGCDAGGGLTLGILPGDDEVAGNAFLDLVIPSGTGDLESEEMVVFTSKAVIVFPGGDRIFSQAVLASACGRPVLSIGNGRVADNVDSAARTTLDQLAMVTDWVKGVYE